MLLPPPTSTLFPYTTLFRSQTGRQRAIQSPSHHLAGERVQNHRQVYKLLLQTDIGDIRYPELDRKSTRLNSSHSQISYAVFCLKKKNKSRMTKNTSTTVLHR